MSRYEKYEDSIYNAVFVLVLMVVLIYGGALLKGIY